MKESVFGHLGMNQKKGVVGGRSVSRSPSGSRSRSVEASPRVKQSPSIILPKKKKKKQSPSLRPKNLVQLSMGLCFSSCGLCVLKKLLSLALLKDICAVM